MDILNQVVERLTKDELRYINMRYAQGGNANRKDMQLLNAVRRQGSAFKEDAVIKSLGYSLTDKNSYYRLKNRVIEDVGDALGILYTHKDESLELLHYLALFNIYFLKNLYQPCYFYLKKAERAARSAESFALLENVYDNFIRLSFHLVDINPHYYIEKRKENTVLVGKLRELDDYLADVSYRLKLTQNFGSADKLMLHKLQQKAKNIAAQTTSGYSKSLQTRIYKALSQVFLQQRNYAQLEELVRGTLQTFTQEKWFNRDNHELKLQMLTYYANALYKNGKFKESLTCCEQLGEEIEAYGKLHYDRYLFFYYNLQILNNATLNPAKALKWLDDFEQAMRRKKNYYYDMFIFLNRAGLLYDVGRYKEALKSLVKLYVRDEYRNSDNAFKLKVEISELIITFEAGDMDTLLYRIEQIRKDFKALSRQKSFEMDFAMLSLLKLMATKPDYKSDKNIRNKIQALLKARWHTAGTGDAEIIKYQGWLVRKQDLWHHADKQL